MLSTHPELADKFSPISISWFLINLEDKIPSLLQARHAEIHKCYAGTQTKVLGMGF